MNYALAAQIPALVFVMWLFTAWMCQSFPVLREKRIALVIAHPDDEAMFFSPTLLSLSRPHLNNQIVIICLSTGDADGLGATRRQELKKSALMLGLRSEEHVVVIDDQADFPDSMTAEWDARKLAGVLATYFAPNMASTKASSPPDALVDVIVTFDSQGVSGHPNHRAVHDGCRAFLRDLMKRHTGWKCPVSLYTLTSLNVARKYSGVLDAVVSIGAAVGKAKERGQFPAPMLFVSGPRDVRRAQRAMTKAHVSQMRWFRWGWIGISRYMYINDLKKVKVI